jgi:hypothetical protein
MLGNRAIWLPGGLAWSCTVTPGGSKAFLDGLRASGATAGEAEGAVAEKGGGGIGGEDHRAANTPVLALLARVLSLGAPNHGEQQVCSPEGSSGASFTSKVRVEHNVGTQAPHADSTQRGHVLMPRRQFAARHHSAEANPRQTQEATQASSSWGFGFLTWDLSAGHWAFPGLPRSALLCSLLA